MPETIEVRYKELFKIQAHDFFGVPISGTQVPVYHEYIVYTTHTGSQFYIRGGPELRPGNILPSIGVQSGPYVQGSPDFDDETDDPRQVIRTGEDLSAEFLSMVDRGVAIHNSDTTYKGIFDNSNSTTETLTTETGLGGTPSPPGGGLAPGSNALIDLDSDRWDPPLTCH